MAPVDGVIVGQNDEGSAASRVVAGEVQQVGICPVEGQLLAVLVVYGPNQRDDAITIARLNFSD